jgi:hypothetical protein
MPTKLMMRQFELTYRTAGAPGPSPSRACPSPASQGPDQNHRGRTVAGRTVFGTRCAAEHVTLFGLSTRHRWGSRRLAPFPALEHGELLKLREAIHPKCTRQAVLAC